MSAKTLKRTFFSMSPLKISRIIISFHEKTEEALISLLVFPIRRKYQKEGSVYLSAPKSEDKDLIRQKESGSGYWE